MPKVNRFFYRCRACCHVVAVDGELEMVTSANGARVVATRCACDGKLELMGRVGRKPGLVLDSQRCACDARCTCATGPSCDCSCGGVNHGTGRVVPIEVDAGGVPRLVVQDVDACRVRATEYAAAMAPLRAKLRDLRGQRPAWRDLPTRDEDALQTAISRVAALRTHKGRIKAAADLARAYRSDPILVLENARA